jgi:hypothetical protein
VNFNQRLKNRQNAAMLKRVARAKALAAHTCENCGEKGGHWVNPPFMSLHAMLTGQDDQAGFWICPKLYGADGRRIGGY